MCPEEGNARSSEETGYGSAGDAEDIADVETLRSQLAEEKQKAESHYASWQRSAADFANYKRRTDQERSEATKFANAMLILHLLPIMDDLERALQNISRELAGLTWIDGIHIIYRKLQAALETQGLQPIEAVGQSFDPNLHEAVLREAGEEGKVLSELQRGYTLNGRVIRPSLVRVGTGTPETSEQSSGVEPGQQEPEASQGQSG